MVDEEVALSAGRTVFLREALQGKFLLGEAKLIDALVYMWRNRAQVELRDNEAWAMIGTISELREMKTALDREYRTAASAAQEQLDG